MQSKPRHQMSTATLALFTAVTLRATRCVFFSPRNSSGRSFNSASPCAMVLALYALSAVSPTVQATDFFWAAAVNGSFNDPTKWSPIGAPGTADTAIFNLGIAAYTVTFPGGSVLDPPPNYVINYLRVRQNEVTFRDNSSPFITSPSLSVANSGVSIVVCQDAGEVSVLSTTLRSLSGANASIGRAALARGTINVLAGTLSMSSEIDVGDSGTGTL
jgi:hypothetical protein